MRFLIFVYGDRRCRCFHLSLDKGNSCQILLPKDDFVLEQTVFLKLNNISKEWYIGETEKYKLKKEQFFQLEKQIKGEAVLYRLHTERKYDVFIGDRKICIQLVYHKAAWSMYHKFELKECEIARGKSNIIIRENSTNQEKTIKFLYKKNNWIVNNNGDAEVYINELFVEKSQKLVYGDIIYYFNITLVFLGEYIALEAEEDENAAYGESNYLNKINLGDKVEERSSILTVKKENFHRAPRIMEELEKKRVRIDAPPIVDTQKKHSLFIDIGSMLNMMIPMLGMNLFLIWGTKAEQNQAGVYVYSGLFMAVMSVLSSALWIIILRRYEQKEQEKKTKKKIYDYKRYLKKKDLFIKKQYDATKKIIQSRYLPIDAYLDNPLLKMYLWNRNPYHKDFLMHRIGIGDMNFPMEIELLQEECIAEENLLWTEAEEIQRHYMTLHNVPILLNIEKYNQVGIVGRSEKISMALIRSIILQIALSNCYTEVKIGCIYDSNKVEQFGEWDFCRWLPHIWNSDRKGRYIATCQHEARRLLYELFQIFRDRANGEETGKLRTSLPHYILFITDYRFLEGELFSKYIFNKDMYYGLTVIWIVRERDSLPNTCKLVLEVNEEFTGQYEIDRHSQKKQGIEFDYTTKEVADKLLRSISGVRVAEVEEKTGLPESISFLEMYGAKNIEDLEIEKRWEKNKIFETARVLIGKKAENESCYLDIHERYHGPHGLIAGTTGSGKSEVLQTFILSMAVNFSPEAVSFLLIDYKGEGMAGLFSELPHISGKISNLSDGQAYRAMISIKSENRRRQKIFKEAKVNNINDYTKRYMAGSVGEPIPHLLIIIDEFAELKKAEPEFMQELISVAQVGRSLGVHLILATQKPGGVVDDKIWSNSRFRICLKVQEREDSMDMLHNTDACKITQTGRGYLQVGNDEVYELFQAGWSGALFQKKDKRLSAQLIKIDGMAYSVNQKDKEVESLQENIQSEAAVKMTQLQAISMYVARTAKKLGYGKGKELWMEPLPHFLYLEDVLRQRRIERIKKEEQVKKKSSLHKLKDSLESKLDVCVGVFDNPENQEQPVFSLKLLESGHIGICGRSVSGKSTFLQTFIYSLLTNNLHKEVSLYLLDFNGGGMNIYYSVPQVKLVIQEDEEDKLEKLFKSITEELKKRKKIFSGGNFRQYKDKRNIEKEKKTEEEEFPLILIILDGFAEFCEETYQKYEDELYFILREGEKLGVIIVMSIEAFSGMHISMRLSELFKTKICLYMKDVYAYTEAFDIIQIPVLPQKGIPGRGIAYYGEKLLEFQTALAVEEKNDYERQEKITERLYQM